MVLMLILPWAITWVVGTTFTPQMKGCILCISHCYSWALLMQYIVHVLSTAWLPSCLWRSLFTYFVAKPILTANTTTITNNPSEIKNAVLTCEVSYAYPVPAVTWRFLSETSTDYEEVHKNFSGNYILYRNASLEVYHRFIIDNKHLIFVCTVANKYGSSQRVFHLWNKEIFSKGLLL